MTDLDPFAALMRRYLHSWAAAHDFSVCPQVAADGYTVIMGEHAVRGRDEQYIPATRHAWDQFPTLDLTVHELVLGRDRAAMRFTEHGRCRKYGTDCAWGGVSLYRWDGTRLTECRVEQDYLARRDQQRSGAPDPIQAPLVDAWSGSGEAPTDGVEQTVRAWLVNGGLDGAPVGSLDNEHCAEPERMLLDKSSVEVLDLFGSGSRAAFHVLTSGVYAGGLPRLDGQVGSPGSLYTSGIAAVSADGSIRVRAITDRLGAERRLITK